MGPRSPWPAGRQAADLGNNSATQIWLQAAGEQEHAIIKAALDPGVAAVHELTRLGFVI